MYSHCLIYFFPILVFKRYWPIVYEENSGVIVSEILFVTEELYVLDAKDIGLAVLIVRRNPGLFTGSHGKEEGCYCELPGCS